MNNFKRFILIGALGFPALVFLNTIVFRLILAPGEGFFFVLATAIVVSWILMLTLYYVWAIYFYNINRGWTDKDWEDHKNSVLVQGEEGEPDVQNREHTLGLPAGTVRGTIALSVLVGGMAMLIASLAMPGKFSENEFLVDNFEYIKTAFLMVIAFYFGSKSLEAITKRRKPVYGEDTDEVDESEMTAPPFEFRNGKAAPVADRMSIPSAKPQKAEVPEFYDPAAKG